MKRIPRYILYLLAVYFTGIAVFTFFRLALLIVERKQLALLPAAGKFWLLLQAFWMGFRFDTVVSGYFLLLPFLGLTVAFFCRWQRAWFYKIISIYLGFLYFLAFCLCGADIPYFAYYFSRITVVIYNWTGDAGFIIKMIVQDPMNLFFVCVSLAVYGVFAYILRRYRLKFLENKPQVESPSAPAPVNHWAVNGIIAFMVFVLLFIGIRGRVAWKSPIRVGTAFFSNYAFPNQLGLNPVYTFMRSWLDALKKENQALHLREDAAAVELVKKYFNINSSTAGQFKSPIARQVVPLGQQRKMNVVLVLVESLAAAKMTRYGNTDRLTPNLDRIAGRSYCFDNIYAAGLHTYNGIYSVLFSFPALLKKHPMKTTVIDNYSGFSNTLSKNGYRSIYFTTHDEQFDNAAGFLRANRFQDIVSQKDYPSEWILSTLGVPDHYMFQFALPRLQELYQQGDPFLAVFMTASDHVPFVIPADIPFKPRNSDKRLQIVEYSDWAIGRFMAAVEKEPWFSNTIFVFTGDHGAVWGQDVYDIPLSYLHIPLLIYAPQLLPEPKTFDAVGGQVDIFPTVMGLLGIQYVNNTMGIDLINQQRPYIYFSVDDKIGCLDREYFYIWRDNGLESLYRYPQADMQNYLTTHRAKADEMKDYAFSMMQASQWLIQNHFTADDK